MRSVLAVRPTSVNAPAEVFSTGGSGSFSFPVEFGYTGSYDSVKRYVRHLKAGMPKQVVGVMPAEYRFPRHHRFWAPLSLNVNAYDPGEGPNLTLCGRLADGVSLELALSELTPLGPGPAAAP